MGEETKSKNLLGSKTIIGVIIALLPTVLGWAGLSVGAGFEMAAEETINDGITLFGSALAAYGRFKANRKVVFGKGHD